MIAVRIAKPWDHQTRNQDVELEQSDLEKSGIQVLSVMNRNTNFLISVKKVSCGIQDQHNLPEGIVSRVG